MSRGNHRVRYCRECGYRPPVRVVPPKPEVPMDWRRVPAVLGGLLARRPEFADMALAGSRAAAGFIEGA